MNVLPIPRRCSCVVSVAVETSRSVVAPPRATSSSRGAPDAERRRAHLGGVTFGCAPNGSSRRVGLDDRVARPADALELDLDDVAGLDRPRVRRACR